VRWHIATRHFNTTHALANGVDVRTLAERNGWANPNVLLSVYAHSLPEKDREAASIIAGVVGV
jgi:integrase